jgi:hypothetical protein
MIMPTKIARFFGAAYQNVEKYTNFPQNIPNGHNVYKMAVK